MLRRLFTPRWLGALLAAVVFGVAAWFLGGWQYSRHEAKVARNDRLDARYAAQPRPLATVLTPAPVGSEEDWTPVWVVGEYGPGPLWVRNRTNASAAGFEVLWPLRTAAGVVIVDRGWVAASAEGADVLPSVAAAPRGEVRVVGWVRPGEASRHRDLPTGQLASINLGEASTAVGAPTLGGYLLLDSETVASGTAVTDRPTPLAPPDRSLGPHLAYAYQWWISMPVGLVLIWFGIRRELRSEDPTYVPVKRTRRTDEDIEDAEVE